MIKGNIYYLCNQNMGRGCSRQVDVNNVIFYNAILGLRNYYLLLNKKRTGKYELLPKTEEHLIVHVKITTNLLNCNPKETDSYKYLVLYPAI